MGDEFSRILGPLDYVDFFSADLIYNRGNTHTLLADKRPHRVNALFVRDHRDF